MTDRIAFKSAGAKSKARQLYDLFEFGVSFEDAIDGLGLAERAKEFRDSWDRWTCDRTHQRLEAALRR